MNILSFLNISNIDNIGCDSGFIFQKQLGESLIEQGHTFILVIPGSIENTPIEVRYHNFGSNKFQVRYSFNWENISDIITSAEFDIILSNQPELSANLRAVLLSENLDTRLYTYVHYYPFSVDFAGKIIYDSSLNNANFCSSIILSFLSGLLASDKVLVHSKYSIDLLKAIFREHNIPVSSIDISILPPPYDDELATRAAKQSSSNSILYNHRLYKQYGTEFLLDFATNIESRYNWKITVTDLLYNRNPNRIGLDKSVDDFRSRLSQLSNIDFRNDGNNRATYKNIIQSSKISLAPFRRNCTWSMSVVDCMSAGVPVVAPNFAWFTEFLPPELLYDSQPEMISIIDRLFNDPVFYNAAADSVSQIIVDSDLNCAELSRKFIEIEIASVPEIALT